MSTPNLKLNRRQLLLATLHSTAAVALSGCEKTFDSLSESETVQSILASAEQANRRVQRMLTTRNKLARDSHKKTSPLSFAPTAIRHR